MWSLLDALSRCALAVIAQWRSRGQSLQLTICMESPLDGHRRHGNSCALES